MYFEILKQGKVVKRGDKTLSPLSWDVELMMVPQLSLTLPIEYLEYISGREEIKIYVNNKCFWGIIKDVDVDKADETIDLSIEHIISEWEYRQISINRAIQNGQLNVIYEGDKTVRSKSNEEKITASNFYITKKELANATNALLIRKAGAQAWKIANGDPVDVVAAVEEVTETKTGSRTLTAKEKGEQLVEYAKQFVGTPYVWGGESLTKGCDCSGFTMLVYRHYGISLPHYNLSQLNYGRAVSQAQAQAGDLIIYQGHVAIYMGDNQRIHATTPAVKIDNYPFYDKVVGIRRIFGTSTDKSTDRMFNNAEVKKAEVTGYTVTFSTAKGTSVTVDMKIGDEENSSQGDATIVDNISDIINESAFSYPGWEIDIQGNAGEKVIDYVYSKQNKLEALTKTCELTDDLFWRVGFEDAKRVEIGVFGEKKPYIFSLKPSGESNIRIIDEPTIDYDFDNVINIATVYSEKSDSGMSSMTLREVYNEDVGTAYGAKAGFPVIILRDEVNNEREYKQYISQLPDVAPNNWTEYSIVDEESVALEGGALIEGAYAFNDLGAFNVDSKKITDAKRKRAAKTAYNAAVRKLKQSRRSIKTIITTEEIPVDIWVGDKVRLIYDNNLWELEACSNYQKKIMTMNDWFYVTRISYSIDGDHVEINELVLEKELKTDRETNNQ